MPATTTPGGTTADVPARAAGPAVTAPDEPRAESCAEPADHGPQPATPGPAPVRRARRDAAWVVLAVLAGGAVGGGVATWLPERSTASTALLVTASAASLVDRSAPLDPDDRDVITQTDLLSSGLVQDQARAAFGAGLPSLDVSSSADSNVVVARVTEEDAGDAARAVDAYVSAYLAVLAAQQTSQLQVESDRVTGLADSYRGQLAELDAALGAADEDDRGIVLDSQQSLRGSAADELRDATDEAARLQALLTRTPATVERLQDSPVTTAVPTSSALLVGVGAAVGGVLALGWRRWRSVRG